jgi:fibronectin-binding autotransporter adhesin
VPSRRLTNLARLALVLAPLAVLGISRQAVANGKTCIWNAGAAANFNSNNWKNCESGGSNPPSGTDVAQFDATSTKNCTISANLSIPQISMNSGYTGTLAVGTSATTVSLTVTGALTINAGTLSVSGVSGASTVSAGSMSIGGGTFSGSSSTTSVGGAFTYSSGTFTASSGTVSLTGTSSTVQGGTGTNAFNALSISGSYTIAGGTLATSGDLTLTGTLATSTFNLSVGGALNQSAGTFTGGSGTVGITGGLNVSGGTFNGAGGNITAGSVAISGSGTFKASSATTSVGGAFTNTGGTFNANGGTVTLTGSGSLSPSGSYSFNNLTVGASGTYTLGSALLVATDLSITSGTLKDAGFSTTVTGSWSNAGTFTSTGAVTLNGTSAAGTIRSGGSSFGSLTISGGGGTYTLQDALPTTGNLTLSNGTLAASTFNLSVGGTLTLSGGSFTGGSGTVGITGNLTMTTGTYTGGSGSATVQGAVDVSATVTNGGDPTLVGYWAFDDTPNHTADSSANANTLTWSGTPTFLSTGLPPVSFTDAYAVSMTGTQSGATSALSGNAELRPNTVTVSAWYKATSTDTTAAEVVSGSNTYGLRVTTTGLTVMKRIACNGTPTADWIEYRVPFSGVLDGTWHQIVGVIVTGTGGGMSAYLDGVIATGAYWVNGSGGASQLSASTSPTATAAAEDAIDWTTGTCSTESYGLVIGNNPSTTGYQFGKGCSAGACAIDDVRVYNRALTASEVAALANGNQPASSQGVLTLAGAMTVTGSVTIQSTGTLTLGSGSSLAVGGLTMDGTLNATSATIKGASGSYAFQVGSTATAAPALNINGLAVKNTDSNGMYINANSGASTTFTKFDNVAFSSGTAGATTALLNINGSSLYLNSNGCTFDASTTYAVKLTAVGSTNPRALFGNATCATNDATTGLCATSEKKDDDSNNDGIPDSGNGAVVQFIRGAESDTAGALVGFPTAGFDWNTFTYYSTYVTFRDASSGNDVIYVRDEAGNPLYSWTDTTAGETLVGTPKWTTTSGGTHYLFVAANGGSSNTGKVYRLVDTGTGTTSGTLTLDTSFNASSGGAVSGVYSCSCTITSPLSIDKNNVYWAATNASGQRLFGIKQSDGTSPSATTGSWPVTAPANVTTSAPTLVISGTTSSLFLGVTSVLAEIADTTKLTWLQDNPTGIGTVTGRLSYGTSWLAATSGTTRIYVGDSNGAVWAVSPSAFSATGPPTTYLWKYAGGSAVTDNYYDGGTDTVMFGTSAGKVVALTGAGSGTSGAVVNSSYPYTLPNSDSVSTAPLYYNGVLAVGSSKGNLYFLDRDTGNATAPNGVTILKEVNFGSTQSVSTIGFDSTVSRYMVSTSSAANDGRVYYFDIVSDPTPSTQ